MTPGPVLVVTALPEEARPVRRALRANRDIVVATTGDGAGAAAASTRRLLSEHRPRLLVVAGLAGALTRTVAAGEVRVVRELRRVAGPVRRPEAEILDRARRAGFADAILVSATGLARTPLERDRMRRLVGIPVAATGLVDLETAACVDAAEGEGVPWLAVRAVSDGVDDYLPVWLEAPQGGDGAVSRSAVAFGALRHPGRIPALLGLARRARAGGRALARAIPKIVAAAAPAVGTEESLSGKRA